MTTNTTAYNFKNADARSTYNDMWVLYHSNMRTF